MTIRLALARSAEVRHMAKHSPYPPGSWQAHEAIARVGRVICGKHWKPASERIDAGVCRDCGAAIRETHTRCDPCTTAWRAARMSAVGKAKRTCPDCGLLYDGANGRMRCQPCEATHYRVRKAGKGVAA